MNPTRPRAHPIRHGVRSATPQLVVAAAAAAGVVLLAKHLRFDEPPAFDRKIRAWTQPARARGVERLLVPLFPVGLPGGYITIAYVTARWLRRRHRRGGPAIVASGWLGWLVHRAVKLFYFRERPCAPDRGCRIDSYPSGHTTGATSLALTTALVLRRQGLISVPVVVLIAAGTPALMGSYRVIADDHWATDVVGGWLLGAAIGLTCNAALADAKDVVPQWIVAPARSRIRRSPSRERGTEARA